MGVLSTVQILSAVVFCTLIAASAAQSEEQSRVSLVGENQAPYHVSIWFSKIVTCDGTLIDSNHVLTSAHCVAYIPRHQYFPNMRVKTGTNWLYLNGEYHHVQSIAIHPNFTFAADGFHNNDIAVIKLKDSVVMSQTQQVINLSSNELADGTQAVVTGWPRNATTWYLRKATSTIISNEACQEKMDNALKPNLFCTFDASEPNVCVGNVGSPLVRNNELVGMVVRANQCGTAFPYLYVSIAPYRAYILQAMSQNNSNNIL